MNTFPKARSIEVISKAILKLPLLPEKFDLVEQATTEILWAAMLAPIKSEKQRDNDHRHSVVRARGEIKNLIKSIDRFLSRANELSSVASRSIDCQTTAEIIADDIGYVYVSNARMSMDALRDKAKDALSDFPQLKSPEGRPHKNGPAENVTEVAGQWYEKLTGKNITRKHDPHTGKNVSLFTKFLDEVLTALSLRGSSDSLTRRSKEKKARIRSN